MEISLQLQGSRVERLLLNKDIELESSKSNVKSLSVFTKFPNSDSESRDFLVTFEIVLSLSQGYLLEIEHSSIFTSNVNLDKKFQESNFPKVNAPAIAYPFLRTFIANFLLNSGYEPIILPSINFTKFKICFKKKLL